LINKKEQIMTSTTKRLLPLLAAVALTLALLFATGAVAFVHVDQAGAAGLRQTGLGHGTSLNWSGYAIETSLSSPQSNAVSDVRGSWTVPTVTSSSYSTYSSIWVGIDGYSDKTVEQIGTEQDWVNGAARYYAWYEMYPKGSVVISTSTYPVSPGDHLTAEVSYTGSNSFTLTLSDTTADWTFTTTQKANALRQSAEWIVEAPSFGSILPLANFDVANISGALATLNDHTGTISDSSWANDAITMVAKNGTTMAEPSSLSSDGSSFSVTWLSSGKKASGHGKSPNHSLLLP
jgi:hypothetical protein